MHKRIYTLYILYICINIYIYQEREREWERERMIMLHWEPQRLVCLPYFISISMARIFSYFCSYVELKQVSNNIYTNIKSMYKYTYPEKPVCRYMFTSMRCMYSILFSIRMLVCYRPKPRLMNSLHFSQFTFYILLFLLQMRATYKHVLVPTTIQYWMKSKNTKNHIYKYMFK